MNITKIKVNLTGEDLLSIYSEFVSVEGLEVKNIEISDGINITGRLNKGFNIDFLVNLKFESYENNIIKIEITKIKGLNIGILKFIKNMDNMDLVHAITIADYISKEKYDGHSTLLCFTTGCKFCFGTLDKINYNTTSLMASGKNIEEAIKNAIDKKIDADKVLDNEEKMFK